MAKPIVTTDVPGCRNVVDDGVNGYLCEVKNAYDLAVKMEARGVAPSVAAVAVDKVATDENRVAAPHERKRLIRIAVVEIRGKYEC